jgi:uncharacterized protein (DUF433 family)
MIGISFSRLSASPEILGGKPCIKGTRLSVQFILELIADGATAQDITHAYPHIQVEDVQECVRYAAHSFEHEIIADIPLQSASQLAV